MKLDEMRESENVDERTSMGSGGGFPIGGGGIKLGGGALILIVIVSLLFGINPLSLIGGIESGAPPQVQPEPGYGPQRSPAPPPDAARDKAEGLAKRVLGDTEDVWGAIFKTLGAQYAPPRLHPFEGGARSACGLAATAVGPFYCPGDQKVYLD